jgi:hypothetical protein
MQNLSICRHLTEKNMRLIDLAFLVVKFAYVRLDWQNLPKFNKQLAVIFNFYWAGVTIYYSCSENKNKRKEKKNGKIL